jgi:hypothetical protein
MSLNERLKKLENALSNDACTECGYGSAPPKLMAFTPIEYDAGGRQIRPPPPEPCTKCGRIPNDEMQFFPITFDGDKIANDL